MVSFYKYDGMAGATVDRAITEREAELLTEEADQLRRDLEVACSRIGEAEDLDALRRQAERLDRIDFGLGMESADAPRLLAIIRKEDSDRCHQARERAKRVRARIDGVVAAADLMAQASEALADAPTPEELNPYRVEQPDDVNALTDMELRDLIATLRRDARSAATRRERYADAYAALTGGIAKDSIRRGLKVARGLVNREDAYMVALDDALANLEFERNRRADQKRMASMTPNDMAATMADLQARLEALEGAQAE